MKRSRGATGSAEAGFTLLEVLIVLILLSLLMGALSTTIIVSLKATAGTSTRLSTSHDRQLVAVYLPRDLASASSAVSGSSVSSWNCAPQAPAPTPTLVLTWRGVPPTTQDPPVSTAVTYGFEADYAVIQSGTNWRLVRYYCNQPPGGSWSTASRATMVYGLQSQTAAAVTCASSPSGTGAGCNQPTPPPNAPWVTLTVTDTTAASYSVTGQMRTNS